MGCRCGDIAQHESELGRLQSSVRPCLETAVGNAVPVTAGLQAGAKAFEQTFSGQNIWDVADLLRQAGDTANTRAGEALTACNSEIARLENVLAGLRSEDAAHHAWEAEMQAQAAAAKMSSK